MVLDSFSTHSSNIHTQIFLFTLEYRYNTKKTVEGTTAAALVTSLLSVTLVSSENYISVTAFVTMTCLLETFTEQMDNLILPLYLFSLFSLLNQ